MDTDRSVPKGTDCMKAAKSFIGLFEGHKPRRSRANSVPFRSICGGSIMESNEIEISHDRVWWQTHGTYFGIGPLASLID
jgi:hypothetical protein